MKSRCGHKLKRLVQFALMTAIIPQDENKILGLPRRPRLADSSAAALMSGVALGLLTGSIGWALAGGAVGGAWANKKQPLELAIREYFKTKNLEVIFFYRAPRAVKVSFSYARNAYWTVESVMPDSLILADEDREIGFTAV